MTIFLAGLGLGLSLIIAIGAQNVFVLRQGARREHVLVVVAICAVSDAVLIAAGVAGLGAVIASMSWLTVAARVGGAAFLLGYAALAARRALRPATGVSTALLDGDGALDGQGTSESKATGTKPGHAFAQQSAVTAAGTALALTWLNPHVYLDTVLLLGSVAASYEDAKWIFAAGAITGSVVWFTALGYGSRLLSGVLARPGAWRVLDGVIAVLMVMIAITLLMGL